MRVNEEIVLFFSIVKWLFIATLTLLFSRDYLGLGLNLMESCLKGASIVWYAFLLKALFTLSVGQSGSVIAPLLFIGATAGSFFADLVGLDRATFSAIGFVSILAGATNTPYQYSGNRVVRRYGGSLLGCFLRD